MARKHGVVKVNVWEQGSDFRALTRDAQRVYMLLISQPTINNCGVLAYTPERWSRMATDDSLRAHKRALRELSDHNFVVCDTAAQELLVRTFIKHDNIEGQPNLVKSAKKQFREIESLDIKRTLAAMHPWLSEGWVDPLEEAHREGVREALREALSEGVREGVYAHAPVTPTPTPSPTPEVLSEKQAVAVGVGELPAEKQIELDKLMKAIGSHADDGTVTILTPLVRDLPLPLTAAIREQLTGRGKIKNRAGYAVTALLSEQRFRRRNANGNASHDIDEEDAA